MDLLSDSYLILPSTVTPFSWNTIFVSSTTSSAFRASSTSYRCTTIPFPCVFSTIFMAAVEDKNERSPPIIISVPMPPSYLSHISLPSIFSTETFTPMLFSISPRNGTFTLTLASALTVCSSMVDKLIYRPVFALMRDWISEYSNLTCIYLHVISYCYVMLR